MREDEEGGMETGEPSHTHTHTLLMLCWLSVYKFWFISVSSDEVAVQEELIKPALVQKDVEKVCTCTMSCICTCVYRLYVLAKVAVQH